MPPHPNQYKYLLEALKHPPTDISACMEWPFPLTACGYGRLKHQGHRTLAHRLAYILHYGPIPPGNWFICHKCDNPKCFRPPHLFPGTPADNTHDAIGKGRWQDYARGEAHRNSKITEAQVREMNAMYLAGTYKKTAIAKQFGITRQQLTHIINRTQWTHLTDLSWDRPA